MRRAFFKGVMGLAFVHADLGAALHIGIEQPVDDKEGSFNAPNLAKRQRQLMLAGI